MNWNIRLLSVDYKNYTVLDRLTACYLVENYFYPTEVSVHKYMKYARSCEYSVVDSDWYFDLCKVSCAVKTHV